MQNEELSDLNKATDPIDINFTADAIKKIMLIYRLLIQSFVC